MGGAASALQRASEMQEMTNECALTTWAYAVKKRLENTGLVRFVQILVTKTVEDPVDFAKIMVEQASVLLRVQSILERKNGIAMFMEPAICVQILVAKTVEDPEDFV